MQRRILVQRLNFLKKLEAHAQRKSVFAVGTGRSVKALRDELSSLKQLWLEAETDDWEK